MLPLTLRKFMLMRGADRGLRWTSVLRDAEKQLVKVRMHAGLVPIGDHDGAVLAWMFDMKPGAVQTLFVRLTEDEADKVFSADPFTVGLLEPVRRRIHAKWAVLVVKNGETFYSCPYRIPRRVSEDEFIADLEQHALTCPAFSLGHRKHLPMAQSRAESFAQQMAKDLALA